MKITFIMEQRKSFIFMFILFLTIFTFINLANALFTNEERQKQSFKMHWIFNNSIYTNIFVVDYIMPSFKYKLDKKN